MPLPEQTGALLRRSGTHRNEFPTGYSWRVALQQSPLPLHRSISFSNRGPVLVHSFPANGRCPLPRLSHPWGEVQTNALILAVHFGRTSAEDSGQSTLHPFSLAGVFFVGEC